jgi:hypothetical protein
MSLPRGWTRSIELSGSSWISEQIAVYEEGVPFVAGNTDAVGPTELQWIAFGHGLPPGSSRPNTHEEWLDLSGQGQLAAPTQFSWEQLTDCQFIFGRHPWSEPQATFLTFGPSTGSKHVCFSRIRGG